MDDDVGLLIPDNNPSPAPQTSAETRNDNSLFIRETEKNFQKIGITMIVLGFLSVGFGIGVYCAYYPGMDGSGSGIWTGLPAVVCGALSITIKYQRGFPVVLTTMIISLVASMFGLVGIGLSVSNFFGICFYCGQGYLMLIPVGILLSIQVAWITLAILMAVISARMVHAKSSNNCCCKDVSSNNSSVPMAYMPGYGVQPITGQQVCHQLMPIIGQNAVQSTMTRPLNSQQTTS